MAVQKNFVVKNGIEVNENLIFADRDLNKVGIGTTVTPEKLQVNGGIGATSIVLSGVGTIPILKSTNGTITSLEGTTLEYDSGYIVTGVVTSLSGSTLNYSGISTVGSLHVNSTQVISSGRQLQNILSLDSTTTSTIDAALPKTFTNLTVTGVSTFGTVKVGSGIITATSGIVTYYGDGNNLTLSGNSDLLSFRGIGIQTGNTLIGYGVTFIQFRGSGVSTGYYNSSSGIATVFFQGGGGGSIGIGSTFPGTPSSLDPNPVNGNLFYHIDYGRTFIYYDEIALGIGSTAIWVDSSPFNQVLVDPVLTGVAFSVGSAISPSAYFYGDPTTGWFSPTGGQFTIVSVGSSILNVNPTGVNVSGIFTSGSISIGSTQVISSGRQLQNILSLDSTTTSTIQSVIASAPSSFSSIEVTGISTFTNGPLLIGSGSSTGTISQPLQVTGNTYISGNLGVGTTNAQYNVDVVGDINLTGSLYQNGILFASGIGIATEGGTVGTGATLIDFRGSGISTVTVSSGIATVNISGGGGGGSILIVDDTTTNDTYYIGIADTTTGSLSTLNVSSTKLTFNPSTGTLSATEVSTSSDLLLKENVKTIENAISSVNSLRGVKFDWKEDGRTSYGVIAQELENVFPELVNTGEIKTVNYNGIIAVLIESMKELSIEVENLKNKLDTSSN